MNRDEFISQYGHRIAKCESKISHVEHSWDFPEIGKVWCEGQIWNLEAFDDRTIRPLICDGSAPHRHHVWEDSEGCRWSCSGAVLINSEDKYHPAKPLVKSIDERYGQAKRELEMDPEKISRTKTALAKWADPAMFEAEPMPTANGPQVFLLWMTPDPLGAIAAACKMYKGEVVRDLATITDAERLEYLEQIQKTKLKAPFEFVKFHFMIEGVTRAFTHQLVRQRTAVYAQESLRFAVKSDMPMYLPPSIAANPDAQRVWEEDNQRVGDTYHKLIDMGIPAEDARGRLPHDILTRVHYSTDLRALLDHAGNRLCTQAQFEWRLVFARLVESIRSKAYGNPQTGQHTPEYANGTTKVYMANELTGLFKPVCYQTGKCEFKANFDRACSIRDRVDAFESAGIPSNGWHSEGWVDKERSPLAAIKPGEWLLDHTAARHAG